MSKPLLSPMVLKNSYRPHKFCVADVSDAKWSLRPWNHVSQPHDALDENR
jgi:hypothetical protein